MSKKNPLFASKKPTDYRKFFEIVSDIVYRFREHETNRALACLGEWVKDSLEEIPEASAMDILEHVHRDWYGRDELADDLHARMSRMKTRVVDFSGFDRGDFLLLFLDSTNHWPVDTRTLAELASYVWTRIINNEHIERKYDYPPKSYYTIDREHPEMLDAEILEDLAKLRNYGKAFQVVNNEESTNAHLRGQQWWVLSGYGAHSAKSQAQRTPDYFIGTIRDVTRYAMDKDHGNWWEREV